MMTEKKWFVSHIINFYKNCVSYLELWGNQFDELKHFKWVSMKHTVEWKDVETTLNSAKKCINEYNMLVENQLFDKVSYLRCYLTTEKLE